MLRLVGWLLTLFVVSFHFFPRLVIRGLFGDGLLYSSMARNMAEGRGSFWLPKFSDGYWLDYVLPNYFENPPLMLWLQSLFFRFFGDHWWVEKLFCVPVLVLNILLVRLVWLSVFHENKIAKTFDWLPVFLWFFIPTVIWGNANNLMDNAQLTFCLAAFWVVLGIERTENLRNLKGFANLWLAPLLIFLGLITKSPVAFYVCAVPFLRQVFIFQERRWLGFLKSSGLFLATIVFFGLLIWSSADAQFFFQNFWQQRLSAVIFGSRDDAAMVGFARFSVFKMVAVEILPLAGIAVLVFVWMKIKNFRAIPKLPKLKIPTFLGLLNIPESSFFFAVGLAATLPILVSARQNPMYLLPGLPMFGLAAAAMLLPSLQFLTKDFTEKNLRRAAWFFAAGLVGVAIHCFFIFGKPMRETEIQMGLKTLKKIVPVGEKVAACPELKQDFMMHTYLQRFHKIEILPDSAAVQFGLICKKCRASGNLNFQNRKIENEVAAAGGYFWILKMSDFKKSE